MVDGLLGQLGLLLAACAARPSARLAELPALTPAAAATLAPWQVAPALPPAPASSLADLVWAQAARTPHAPALVWQTTTLSYQTLTAQADILAAQLQARGVGPETIVGVCLARTPALPIALLAVLRAGAAYLPLDPAAPPARLAQLAADAPLSALLTQADLVERLPSAAQPTLCLDPLSGAALDAPPAPALVVPAIHPASLAYLITTSGSTGTPKAVAISHASAVAFLQWATQHFTPADLAGVLAATAVTFDLAVFELFAPWWVGGTVILAPDALALPALPARDQVTLLNTVPSAMQALLASGALPPGLRAVNLAGEALAAPLAQAVLAACPPPASATSTAPPRPPPTPPSHRSTPAPP